MKLFSLHCVIGRVQQTYEGKRKFLKEETEALRGEVIYPLSCIREQGSPMASHASRPCLPRITYFSSAPPSHIPSEATRSCQKHELYLNLVLAAPALRMLSRLSSVA